MDYARKVRLPRMKGEKRLPAAVPTEWERESDGGDMGRDRFHALWRDYHDLLKETEAKKRRLESISQRKLVLLAEVKFLRKKYNSFAKGDSQQAYYRLKKKAQETPPPAGSSDASAFAHPATVEVPSTGKSTNFDLNQSSMMNDEGADCPGNRGHSQLGKLDISL